MSNEYDRREKEIKTLGKSKITPDLIVHHVVIKLTTGFTPDFMDTYEKADEECSS